MKRLFSLIMVLLLSFSLASCADTRSETEKFADKQYDKAKNTIKEQGLISQSKSKQMDKAYNDVKDAVKSVGDLFGN